MRYKRGKISQFSLFAMLFVSHVLVVFTLCNVTSLGKYSSDLLISTAIGLVNRIADNAFAQHQTERFASAEMAFNIIRDIFSLSRSCYDRQIFVLCFNGA